MIHSVAEYLEIDAPPAGLGLVLRLPGRAGRQEERPAVKPLAGPRATALRVTWLYVSPDKSAQKVDRVQIGREMVVAEKSGPWMRVYANTDIRGRAHQRSARIFGANETPPPISGWIRSQRHRGRRHTQRRSDPDGRGGIQEAEASDPKGPANAARSAHLLYRRLAEMFPNSPLAPEAAWRAADILWQIQKSRFQLAALCKRARSIHARPDG